MNILFKKVFEFDWDNSTATEINILPTEIDFIQYTDDLIKDVMGDKRGRHYDFPEFDTGIKSIIAAIQNEKIDEGCNSSAQRLLQCEVDAQTRIARLKKEIHKGLMVQALVEIAGTKYYVIIKAEHIDYIDEIKRAKSKGLPIKRKIFKSFFAELDSTGIAIKAMANDSGERIATYWWKEFLELKIVHDNSYNTDKAFEALDGAVFSKIKKESPEDYMYLRNATIQYFRSNVEFVLEDYVEKTIRNYHPASEKLTIADIERKIVSLPEKNKFDQRFDIEKSAITQRMVNKLKLSDQLILEIKEDIDWDGTVTAYDENGTRGIKIRTEEGFKYFKKETKN